MIDQHYVEQNDIVNKYSCGELTAEETEAFEVYLMENPELIEQLELDAIFRKQMPHINIDKSASQQSWLRLFNSPVWASLATLTGCLLLGFFFFKSGVTTSTLNEVSTNTAYARIKTPRSQDITQVNNIVVNQSTNRLLLIIRPYQPTKRVEDAEKVFNVSLGEKSGARYVIYSDEVRLTPKSELVIDIPTKLLTNATYQVNVKGTVNHTEQKFYFSITKF